MDKIVEFLTSGIMVRLYSVSLISAGILAIAWYTSMLNSKKSGRKVEREISPRVHLISAILNIVASMIVSWRYDRDEMLPADYLVEGAIFGIVATGAYFVLTSNEFLKILTVWRKK